MTSNQLFSIIRDGEINFRVKSKTREIYHFVNIQKNECSCESKLHRGLYKKDQEYQCEHIQRVNEYLQSKERQTIHGDKE